MSKKNSSVKIYIGPTIKGIITEYDCFTDKLPKLDEEIKDLIVDYKDFRESIKLIEDRKGHLWKKYRELVNREENVDV